jgi:hypothetical protein
MLEKRPSNFFEGVYGEVVNTILTFFLNQEDFKIREKI